ncbi:MAG TPA: hypothetical protein VJ011_10360 [Steroidobacteraceae bacterium]|nr:hypothetical protein [Steroidobacteraceae bacterium]
MARASNLSPASPAPAVPVVAERRIGCPRVRFRAAVQARNVCRVQVYVRVSSCPKSQMARTAVHWFDPRLARIIEVAGRLH